MIPHRNGLECDVCGKKATALYGVMCCLSCQEKVGRGVYRQSKWIEEVAHECEVAGIPFFDKRKTGWIRREWPT